jgi:DNA-binding transcriptional regulator GbsR (MarR family)
VHVTQTLGDRRDFFVAQRDPWEVVRIIVEGRKRRELDPTVNFLKECAAELESDSETPAYVKEQIAGQLEFMETLMGWYESIKGLPRKTLLKMMRLGQRIAKVIGD